jgi:hypothetical protein
MGVNTVRLWGKLPPNEVLLDKLYNGGNNPIYAIMGVWIDPNLDYNDPNIIRDLEQDFGAYVEEFKSHPAVLGWGIGNEVNLAYLKGGAKEGRSPSEWYALANRLAKEAHRIEGDSYHPTMIINGGLTFLGDTEHGSDDVSLDHVDAWGVNAYFGYEAHCYFDYYHRLSAKPLVVTEFGIDAYDNIAGEEDPNLQAEWDVQQWQAICTSTAGGTVMEYSDEWWKCDNPNLQGTCGFITDTHPDRYSNEEWYGIVSVQDNGASCDVVTPRKAYSALGEEFTSNDTDWDCDSIVDPNDNCPTIPNADQADDDADGVGQVCDNCLNHPNPRLESPASFQNMTGGQLDQDMDGHGNRCDGRFFDFGTLSLPDDLQAFKDSVWKLTSGNDCGGAAANVHTACAEYDLDGVGPVVLPDDLQIMKTLVFQFVGPKCAACPMSCSGPNCP